MVMCSIKDYPLRAYIQGELKVARQRLQDHMPGCYISSCLRHGTIRCSHGIEWSTFVLLWPDLDWKLVKGLHDRMVPNVAS